MQILLFGGSRSGKSSLAEKLVLELAESPDRYYIATMKPEGPESEQRISKHRAQRDGKGFTTLECYTNLSGLTLEPQSTVLLECVGNLVANEMFGSKQGVASPDAAKGLIDDMRILAEHTEHLVIVSNDVGRDGVAYDADTKRYQDALALMNRVLGRESDVVIEMVCGIPLYLKGEDLCPSCDHS